MSWLGVGSGALGLVVLCLLAVEAVPQPASSTAQEVVWLSELCADEPAAVALWTRPGEPVPWSDGPRVIVAAWTTGEVVWSHDLLLGGPPYERAEITSTAIDSVIQSAQEAGFFEERERLNPWGAISLGGPMISLSLRDGDESLFMRDLMPLPFPAEETFIPERWLVYSSAEQQAAWEALRTALLRLIPEQGRATEPVRFVERISASGEEERREAVEENCSSANEPAE